MANSRTYNFTRPVTTRDEDGHVSTWAHWVNVLRYIRDHEWCTRSDCQHAIAPSWGKWWDKWDTNLWGEMIRRGFLEKRTEGRSVFYHITNKGFALMNLAFQKNEKIERKLVPQIAAAKAAAAALAEKKQEVTYVLL